MRTLIERLHDKLDRYVIIHNYGHCSKYISKLLAVVWRIPRNYFNHARFSSSSSLASDNLCLALLLTRVAICRSKFKERQLPFSSPILLVVLNFQLLVHNLIIMKVLVALLMLGVATIAMAATLGMDVSQPTSTKTFQCFVASGYTFAGIRVSILSSSSFD